MLNFFFFFWEKTFSSFPLYLVYFGVVHNSHFIFETSHFFFFLENEQISTIRYFLKNPTEPQVIKNEIQEKKQCNPQLFLFFVVYD